MTISGTSFREELFSHGDERPRSQSLWIPKAVEDAVLLLLDGNSHGGV